MKRFNEIVSNLEGPMADAVRDWVKEMQTDPQTKQVGDVVLDNLQNDQQFEDEPYREFVEILAKKVTPGSCISDFETACREFHKRGPEATKAKTLSLHRLVKRQDLSTRIAEKVDWPVSEADIFYGDLMDSNLTEESVRKEIMSEVTISRYDMVWGGFHQKQTGEDPLAKMPAARAKQVLGLAPEWYPTGEPVVRIEYLPPDRVKQLIPTVADAEWNEYWMPAPAGTGFGLTRDLGSPEKKPGAGEVVHDQGTLDWMVSPCIPDEIEE